jgi:predicted GH43/DUF377 family glycosyl hydrolase
MIKVQSYLLNPILTPNNRNKWENRAVFNGSVSEFKDEFIMAYRAIGDKKNVDGKDIDLSTIGMATSKNLHLFFDRKQIIKPEFLWEEYGCEDPRVCHFGDDFYIFYTAISNFPPSASSIKIAVAKTKDFQTFEKHLITPFNAKAMAMFPKSINGKMVAVLTVNTDLPPSKIALAFFDNEEEMWSPDYWRKWYQELETHELPLRRVTSDQLEIGAVPVETEDGWLLIYSHIQNYYNGKKAIFGIEAVLLDKENPQIIIGKTLKPIMVPQENYEMEGMVPNVIFPSGAIIKNEKLYIYFGAADTSCALAMTDLKDLIAELKKNINPLPKLKRYSGNPILTSREGIDWESRATFNPAAVLINDEIHIIYRAMSLSNTSVFGYAKSLDGFTITERDLEPIYLPREDFELKKKENGFGGCEDPRITRIGEKIYMCYTAYDGESFPKIALTSISVSDFTNKRWNWKKPVIISDPRYDNKDCCILPELVKGQYVFFHRGGCKDIMVDYVPDLEFENNQRLKGEFCLLMGQNNWDNAKTGITFPPIKTESGWLLFYHGVSRDDQNYRVGALLLKLDDPKTILGRSKFPLFEPEMNYEKFGEVNNVVFPCGSVVRGDQITIYYGGADKVVGAATGSIKKIVDLLLR